MAVERRFDPKAFLSEAGDGRSVMLYKSGTMIFRQGDPADLIFYLQRGKAQETVTAKSDKKAIVNILESGSFFGTGGLDGGKHRVSSVTAVTACVVTQLTKAAMKHALDEPRFVRMFLTYLLERNSQIEAEKVDLMFGSSEKRLAQKLLSLSHNGTAALDPKITQQMLAEMIGTTRQYVNAFMTRFKTLGLVQHTSDGTVVNPTLLKVVTEDQVGENR